MFAFTHHNNHIFEIHSLHETRQEAEDIAQEWADDNLKNITQSKDELFLLRGDHIYFDEEVFVRVKEVTVLEVLNYLITRKDKRGVLL